MEYDRTTKYHFPLLTRRNLTALFNSSEEMAPRIVHGPFGFDDSIELKEKQVSKNDCKMLQSLT